jgi:hypothetical protein
VHPVEAFDRFYFNNDRILYEQVDAISGVKAMAAVHQRQWFLTLNLQTTFSEFVHQAGLVRALEHPRPEFAVDAECTADNLVREFIEPFTFSVGSHNHTPGKQGGGYRRESSAPNLPECEVGERMVAGFALAASAALAF